MPQSSIIIPVYNNWNSTRICLRTLAQTAASENIEVIVVDNASTDATSQGCPALGAQLFRDRFSYLRNENSVSLASACNRGARAAKGACLIFLNQNIEFLPVWYGPLLEDFAAFQDLGATGSVLLYPESPLVGSTVRNLGIYVESGGRVGRLYAGVPAKSPLAARRRFFQAITAACLCVPRELFLQTGLFDERYAKGFADVDLSTRLAARGLRLTINPASRLIQHEHPASGWGTYEKANCEHPRSELAARLKPDYAAFAHEDGLELTCSPWLNFLPALPGATIREIEQRAEGMRGRALLELLVEHPYWQDGWERLASESEETRAALVPVRARLFKWLPYRLALCEEALARQDPALARELWQGLARWADGPQVWLDRLRAEYVRTSDDRILQASIGRLVENFADFRRRELRPFLQDYWRLGTRLGSAPRPRVMQDYQSWLEAFDQPPRDARVEGLMKSGIACAMGAPRFSIRMPVYNPDAGYLRAALDSVRGQVWPHWELCIADDASTKPEARAILEEYMALDSRIRVVWRKRNGNIAMATNSALELATAPWAALLDQDDLLSPDALALMADAILQNPQGQLFYSDEDMLSASGMRSVPYFKSNWDPQLILSQNYVSHLGVYATGRLVQLGGERDGFAGSQDHELVLRFTADLPPEAIVHVPHVLYHWRKHPGSTAERLDAKPEAVGSRLKAVREWCSGRAPGAKVADFYGAFAQVHYFAPAGDQQVALICDLGPGISSDIEAILDAWSHFGFAPREFVFIAPRQPDCVLPDNVRVIRADAAHPAEGLRAAADSASAPVLGFVAPALRPLNGQWLAELLGHLARPDVGAVGGALIENEELRLVHAGYLRDATGDLRRLFAGAPAQSSRWYCWNALARTVDAVDGLCLFTHREILNRIGLAGAMGAWMFQDYCLRLGQAGLRTVWVPYAQFGLPASAGRSRKPLPAFVRKWRDPGQAFNTNLIIERELFALNLDPRYS